MVEDAITVMEGKDFLCADDLVVYNKLISIRLAIQDIPDQVDLTVYIPIFVQLMKIINEHFLNN